MTETPAIRPAAAHAPVPFWAHILPFFAFFFSAHVLGHFEPWNWLAGALVSAAALAWQRPWRDTAVWAHVMPFALWLSLMTGLGDPAAWKYSVRTVAGLGALLWVRPWQWYGPLRWKNAGLALAVGVAVFVVWVGFESTWVRAWWPGLAEFYEKWAVGPIPDGLGKLREPLKSFPYDPTRTGWIPFVLHMIGTSVIIAVIEEFFWRGFLYRWLAGKNFLALPVQHWDGVLYVVVAVLFGLEHAEWFAGIVCGLAFAGLLRRTGDIWAVILAHGTTNFVLGLYVVLFRQWHFW